MKKNLLMIVLFIGLGASAQNDGRVYVDYPTNNNYKAYTFLSLGLDIKNALQAEWDGVVKLGFREDYLQVGLFYERFADARYQSFGVQPSVVIPLNNSVDFLLGTEASIIERFGPSYPTYAFNSELEIGLGRNFAISLKADLKRRPDIYQKWQYSTYGNLIFKFN